LKENAVAIEIQAPQEATGIWRLPAMVGRAFRLFRAALRHRGTTSELDGLSDRYLSDIGVDRRQISDAVKAEITRSHLLDAGWPRPRRPGWR